MPVKMPPGSSHNRNHDCPTLAGQMPGTGPPGRQTGKAEGREEEGRSSAGAAETRTIPAAPALAVWPPLALGTPPTMHHYSKPRLSTTTRTRRRRPTCLPYNALDASLRRAGWKKVPRQTMTAAMAPWTGARRAVPQAWGSASGESGAAGMGRRAILTGP
jgi:hypothetical protein